MPGITQQPLADMAEPLPPYTTLPQPEPEPPQYTLPERFTIGRNSTHHLVRPDQLKAHLQLLAAFDYLRQRVVASESLIAGLEADSEKRWVWFVNLAVERWYAEDTTRISKLKPLTKFSDYFPTLLANPDLLTTDTPQPERVSAWERHTETPYDPFASIATLTHKPVNCPRCSQTILAPFIQSDGTGYAQSNFSINCKCNYPITKELLGLHKFAKNAVESTSPDKYFAGTLHTPRNIFDIKSGYVIRERLLTSDIFKLTKLNDPVGQILSNILYDAARMRTILSKHDMKPRLLNKIMSAYTDDRVFSLDLVGAVLRQALFVKKMVDLGWTEAGYFSSEVDVVALQHCVARYHAFLSLMAESPASFFVPTLDIDLAWHTHQLMASLYKSDCLILVGRFIDHDDKVEEDQLATSFDLTCRAWSVCLFP
ncbi:hypothetical protein AZE42_13114 [Rhizopogon vesiculosus]|uniref:Uncharacterized protein n=1 Tax=Rhizopogon vesiculosus TaxID=180088 RepID=A0A1J8Q4L4_9AGAM|nr:hypothetical protein AZE42_13114 [Rhizopogon vesiculosus]